MPDSRLQTNRKTYNAMLLERDRSMRLTAQTEALAKEKEEVETEKEVHRNLAEEAREELTQKQFEVPLSRTHQPNEVSRVGLCSLHTPLSLSFSEFLLSIRHFRHHTWEFLAHFAAPYHLMRARRIFSTSCPCSSNAD